MVNRHRNPAIAFVQGNTTKGRVAAGPDAKAIRAKTRLSQAKFASKLRDPVATVRDWEQHRRCPTPPRGRCWGCRCGPNGGAGVDCADSGISGNRAEMSYSAR